jgi:23S rRNA pseudouridine955/2504/2580 synthase
MRKIVVNEKNNNKKLSNFILDSFPNLSRNTLFKALRKKDIRINNIKTSNDEIIHYNDEITLYITDEFLYGSSINIDIIYEDENILVVNKPAGISVTDNNLNVPTLSTLLKNKFGNNINPCHRIDHNTKGLVLFAKNDEVLNILLEKFKNQEIEKHYLAKTYGIPQKNHDILEAYLFKDSKKSFVYISDIPKKDYQKIITEYTVLEKNTSNNTAKLDITLHTGKTHQIRAHLSHINCPILGDGKYGINEINKKFGLKTQELYSYSLTFKFKSDSGILNYLKDKTIKNPKL